MQSYRDQMLHKHLTTGRGSPSRRYRETRREPTAEAVGECQPCDDSSTTGPSPVAFCSQIESVSAGIVRSTPSRLVGECERRQR